MTTLKIKSSELINKFDGLAFLNPDNNFKSELVPTEVIDFSKRLVELERNEGKLYFMGEVQASLKNEYKYSSGTNKVVTINFSGLFYEVEKVYKNGMVKVYSVRYFMGSEILRDL